MEGSGKCVRFAWSGKRVDNRNKTQGWESENEGRTRKKKGNKKKQKLVSELSTNGPVWRAGRLSQVNSGSRNRRPRSWEPNPAGLDVLAAFWPCWFRTHLGKPFENRRQQLQDIQQIGYTMNFADFKFYFQVDDDITHKLAPLKKKKNDFWNFQKERPPQLSSVWITDGSANRSARED